ncbi:PQQ-binding-like beta-propeller repeat protein [Streptomyces sp. NPDC090025]|uniref:serine/threonine-protein kinase n=1 Tax=Streptomyces sp. NPDC090025 TaxID=3365922 RepID=UPI00383266A0
MQPLATGDPLRLGPYRLLAVLGEGGMGKVYLAQDGAGRPAAVKVLRPELAHDQHLAQRFVREAEMARAVTSKGVARVLDARTEGGRPWLAAEFLAGPTLDEAIRTHGPMDEPTVRALVHFLARTLRDIHAAGLVHRDLKPANIVLTSSGPRVIDFGIARPEHGLTLTTTGQIPVTPGYGAPEQVLGHRVGPACDVFSLGAVLGYAASGRRTFEGAHVAAVQYEVVHGHPDLAGLPPALSQLIEPCLAKDPAHRPTPEQIVTAVPAPKGAERAWRKGPLATAIAEREATVKRLVVAAPMAPGSPTGPVPGEGVTAVPPTGSASSSRRRFLALGGGGVLAAAGAGWGAKWLVFDRNAAGDTDFDAEVPAAVATPAAAFVSLIDAKAGEAPKPLWGPHDVAAMDGLTPLPVRDVLVVQAKAGGLLALGVADGRQRWQAEDVVARAGFVSVGDRLVVGAAEDGRLHAYVAATGKPVWQTDASVEHLLAADARRVYLVTEKNELRAVDAWTLATVWTRPLASPSIRSLPATAAVGRDRLVVNGRDGHVVAVDPATGKTVWEKRDLGTTGAGPAIGGTLVYLAGGKLTACELADGTVRWTEQARSPGLGGPGWTSPTPDEGVIYVADGYNARRYRTMTDVRFAVSDWYEILEGLGGNITAPAVEGTTVWFAAPDDTHLRVLDKRTHRLLFDVTMQRTGPYRLTSDGNRVFAVRGGRVMAMPVFGT